MWRSTKSLDELDQGRNNDQQNMLLATRGIALSALASSLTSHTLDSFKKQSPSHQPFAAPVS
jgi:hypothetical protein